MTLRIEPLRAYTTDDEGEFTIAVVRAATKGGRRSSARRPSGASTFHQIAWLRSKHDASVGERRSGLSNPFHAA